MSKDIGALRARLSFEKTGTSDLTNLTRDLKGLKSEMQVFRSHNREFRTGLKGMKSEYDILSRTLKTQQVNVQELKTRYDALKEAKGEDHHQTREAAEAYNKAYAEMNKVEGQLERLGNVIRTQESPWTKLGDNLTNTGDRLKKIGDMGAEFGKNYSLRVTAPIVASGTAFFKASMDYESAFAGVRKTVDATEEEYAKLSAGIREMTKVLPTSATEIAAVAESAGQLGIQNENILTFTRTMMDLGEATNLSAGTAATEFARFANIVGMSQADFDKLGSVVVDLGNNLATTEAEIVSMAMRLAGAGSQIGLTESDIMALAASLSSVGIEAEAGGSAFSKVMVNMQLAAELGGEELKAFADVAGLSASDFKKAFETDAAGAMIAFIEGLSTAEERGMSAIKVLDDMGITEVRMRDALLRAAGATDVFTDSIEMGSKAWEENVALTEEAEQRYATSESQLKIMWNRIKDVAITLGDALVPAVMSAIDAAEPFIKKIEEGATAFSEMDKSQQETILKMIGLVAAIGPVTYGISKTTSTIGGMLQVGGKLSKMLGKSSGAGLIGRIATLGPLGVAGIAVAGLTAVGIAAYNLFKEKSDLNEISTETAEKLYDEAQSLESLANEYDELTSKSKLTKDEFMRLVDIQAELNRTSDPKKIERLQNEYEELQKKSGLSADEIERLLGANESIIEQSPSVEKSFSSQGNAIVDSTDDLREYISTLYEMSQIEMEMERAKALENEAALRKENKELSMDILDVEKDIQFLLDNRNLSMDELNEKLLENRQTHDDINTSAEEQERLMREHNLLEDIRNGKFEKSLDTLKEQRDEMKNKIELNDEELAKLDAINDQYKDMLLGSIGIKDENGEGLEILDKQLENLQKQKKEFEQNATEAEKQTEGYRKNLKLLDDQIESHTKVKEQLDNELGLQSEKSKQEEILLGYLEEEKQHHQDISHRMGNQTEQQEKTNKKVFGGIGLAQGLQKELTKDAKKEVDVTDNGTVKKLNDKAKEPMRKTVTITGVWANLGGIASSLMNRLKRPGYATGTNNHPGGEFIAGEEGWELGLRGNRFEMLDFGLYNRPSGYKVFTHDESKAILQKLNTIPGYATGARSTGEANRTINQLNKQLETVHPIQIDVGQLIVREEADIEKLAKKLNDHIVLKGRRSGVVMNGFIR